MRKSYYLLGMFLILLIHTLIIGLMLTNESKVKVKQASKGNTDFYDKRKINLYPAHHFYVDSTTFKLNSFINKSFVIK